MTEQEAINRLKDHMDVHKLNEPQAHYINIAHEMAISALATQVPVGKILYDNPYTDRSFYTCGVCGETVAKKDKYCKWCGQAFAQ